MKITKTQLKQIIQEELEKMEAVDPLAGPTAAGEPRVPRVSLNPLAGPTASPLAGPTAAQEKDPALDQKGDSTQKLQQKAKAFDEVEKLLTALIKRIQTI